MESVFLVQDDSSGAFETWNCHYATRKQAQRATEDDGGACAYRIIEYKRHLGATQPPRPTKGKRYCFEYKDGRPTLRGLKLVQVLELLAGGARGAVSVDGCK